MIPHQLLLGSRIGFEHPFQYFFRTFLQTGSMSPEPLDPNWFHYPLIFLLLVKYWPITAIFSKLIFATFMLLKQIFTLVQFYSEFFIGFTLHWNKMKTPHHGLQVLHDVASASMPSVISKHWSHPTACTAGWRSPTSHLVYPCLFWNVSSGCCLSLSDLPIFCSFNVTSLKNSQTPDLKYGHIYFLTHHPFTCFT